MSMEGMGEHAPDAGATPLPPAAMIGRRWSVSRPSTGLGSVLLMQAREGSTVSGPAEAAQDAGRAAAPAREPG